MTKEEPIIDKLRAEIINCLEQVQNDMSKDILTKEIDEGVVIGLNMALDIVRDYKDKKGE